MDGEVGPLETGRFRRPGHVVDQERQGRERPTGGIGDAGGQVQQETRSIGDPAVATEGTQIDQVIEHEGTGQSRLVDQDQQAEASQQGKTGQQSVEVVGGTHVDSGRLERWCGNVGGAGGA